MANSRIKRPAGAYRYRNTAAGAEPYRISTSTYLYMYGTSVAQAAVYWSRPADCISHSLHLGYQLISDSSQYHGLHV